MRVMILFEKSGRLRDAFLELGHDAWSCDILPHDVSDERHIIGDALDVVGAYWDLWIAHPPCTLLTNASAHMWKERSREQAWAIATVLAVWAAGPSKTVIENPPGILSKVWRPPTQYVQPFQFGSEMAKKTGLWIRGLPPLVPTSAARAGQSLCQRYSASSRQRSHHRSKLDQHLARAMARQWSDFCQAERDGRRGRVLDGCLAL